MHLLQSLRIADKALGHGSAWDNVPTTFRFLYYYSAVLVLLLGGILTLRAEIILFASLGFVLPQLDDELHESIFGIPHDGKRCDNAHGY